MDRIWTQQSFKDMDEITLKMVMHGNCHGLSSEVQGKGWAPWLGQDHLYSFANIQVLCIVLYQAMPSQNVGGRLADWMLSDGDRRTTNTKSASKHGFPVAETISGNTLTLFCGEQADSVLASVRQWGQQDYNLQHTRNTSVDLDNPTITDPSSTISPNSTIAATDGTFDRQLVSSHSPSPWSFTNGFESRERAWDDIYIGGCEWYQCLKICTGWHQGLWVHYFSPCSTYLAKPTERHYS